MNLIHNMCSKIILLELLPHLPGANELICKLGIFLYFQHNTDPANSQRNCKLYGCEMMRQMKEFLEKGDFCDVILLSTKSSEVLQVRFVRLQYLCATSMG